MRVARGVPAFLILLLLAATARADFHLWQITEIYSNADGSVQFVELFTSQLGQHRLQGHELLSVALGSSFTFPSNLAPNTAGHSFLMATPGFEGVAGIVPDYTLPGPLFFDPGGDTLNLVGADAISFGPGELPVDGIQSLNETFFDMVRTTAPNSPTNFSGETGAIVPEPATGLLVALGLLGLAAGRAARSSRSRSAAHG